MKNFKQKMSKTAFYMQRLMTRSTEVQEAVARKDKDSLLKTCRQLKIPKRYAITLAALLFFGPLPCQLVWPPP